MNDVAAVATWSAVIITLVDIIVSNKFSGSGIIFGLALGILAMGGVLSYDSDDILYSAESHIQVWVAAS